MKKSKIDLSWIGLWLVVISMALVSTACSSQPLITTMSAENTPIPPINTPVPPSSTPIPPTPTPLPPTFTPTPTTLPGPLGYLLTLDDLPSGSEWLYSFDTRSYINPLEIKAYSAVRFYSEDGWLFADLTVANTPYEGIPDGQQFGQGGTPVDAATVGQVSQAYLRSENPPSSSFVFSKGNVLVSFYGPISVDTAVKLAQIMEARISERISDLPPITFPDQLDSITSAKYFKPFAMGKCTDNPQDFIPTTVFSSTHPFDNCLQMEWASQDAAQIKKNEYAIYDLQNQEYKIKYSSAHGFGQLFLPGKPGHYEMRVAADDVLVAVLPFEVR